MARSRWFLVKAGQPDRLEDAPGGKKFLTTDNGLMERGKIVFAETCARCHSSKLPEFAWKALDPGGCSGPGYLERWKRYWSLTKTSEFKAKMREIVAKPDFLENNYLSTDARIPVTLLRSNPRRPGAFMMRQQTGVREHFSLRQYGSYLDCRAAGFLRGVRARHDLRCMVRPCVRKRFLSIWWLCGLASTYSASRRRISGRAISLADRPRTGHSGHQCSHAPGRPILHLVSSSRNSACGKRAVGLVIAGSCVYAVPLFVP